MTNVANFDFSFADAYALKTLPVSDTYRITYPIRFSPSTAGRLGSSVEADVAELDGIYGLFPFSSAWEAYNNTSTVDGGITPSPDVEIPVLIEIAYDVSTLWHVTATVDGTLVGALLTDLGHDNSVGIELMIGARFVGSHDPDDYVLAGAVVVTDSLLAPLFSDDWSSGDFSNWDSVVGSASVVPPPAPPFPTPTSGFFVGYPWRWIVTDLDSVTTTFAEGLLTNRQIALILDDASVIDADVWPDDFRINGLWTDGYPRLAQTNRLVYCLRRDNPSRAGGLPPWTCRAAGIVMSPDDQGNPDVPLTHFTAYDSWRYADARPAMASDGSLPDEANGFQFLPPAFPSGDLIALTMLLNTIINEGTIHVDAGTLWGGTSFYSGTLETTDAVNFTVQRGDSVGDVWRNLCAIGNMDIVLTPIYDPVNRPGYTHELNIYNLAGGDRHDAVFGWDRMNHAVGKISRMHDGTPGEFFNKVQYYSGFGGFPVPASGPLVNTASVADFGSWWTLQFFPGQTDKDPTGAATLALAKQALVLAKQGKRTVTMDPIPERAPILFLKYGIADRVPIYASNRLRVTIDGLQRVEGIPIAIDDDGLEKIGNLLCSPDWRPAP